MTIFLARSRETKSQLWEAAWIVELTVSRQRMTATYREIMMMFFRCQEKCKLLEMGSGSRTTDFYIGQVNAADIWFATLFASTRSGIGTEDDE